jgi:hypothetical protein
MKKYFFLALLCLIIVSPATALITNNTANTAYYQNNVTLISGSFVHQPGYLPVEMVYFIAILAVIFWICSVVSPICEDIFSLITPVLFLISAYYSAYMTIEKITIVVMNGVIYPVHTQIIIGDSLLQLALVGCFVLSILSGIYIVFLRNTDKKLSTKKQYSEY